jgi:two-component system chemotaxis response regulator CheB
MEEREEEEEELELVMTRPGCGGVMREFKDKKTLWYQCMVGHRFSSETMMLEQNRVIEEQLFRTLAFLKEKEEAMRTMASDARASINSPVDPEYFEKQGEAAVKVQERIKNILDEFGASLFPGTPSKELNS